MTPLCDGVNIFERRGRVNEQTHCLSTSAAPSLCYNREMTDSVVPALTKTSFGSLGKLHRSIFYASQTSQIKWEEDSLLARCLLQI